MEVFPASVVLIVRALVVSARWAGKSRRCALEQLSAAAERSWAAQLEARVAWLEDTLELREAYISMSESRLGRRRPRKRYPLMERLRIIWLMEYFRIPGRQLRETLGVSRSSVRRWLRGFAEAKLGKRNEPKEPVNKTPREIAQLIWEIFRQNPLWARHRVAMALWGLGVLIAASTVRNILLRPEPRPEGSPVTAAMKPDRKGRHQIVARYPSHVWSVDRTRVWRWHIWPTWVLVAIDHFSRKILACCALEGPNAGWVVARLETAFLRHGPPKHIISDQESVFVSEAFVELLTDWHIKQRLGAVDRHGSIAVTERAIPTLKQEWLRRVAIGDPRGDRWQRPDRSAKTLSGSIERRFFPDTRTTAYRLAA